MTLEDYCRDKLDGGVWARLSIWCAACEEDAQLKFVRRNVERECNRNDIDEAVWGGFLQHLAAEVPVAAIDLKNLNQEIEKLAEEIWREEGRPENKALDHWLRAKRLLLSRISGKQSDPIDLVGDAFVRGGRKYFLPGRPIPIAGPEFMLRRYMGIAEFLRYNVNQYFPAAAGPLRTRIVQYALLAEQISSGQITANDMRGTNLGRADHPAWCTDDVSTLDLDASVHPTPAALAYRKQFMGQWRLLKLSQRKCPCESQDQSHEFRSHQHM